MLAAAGIGPYRVLRRLRAHNRQASETSGGKSESSERIRINQTRTERITGGHSLASALFLLHQIRRTRLQPCDPSATWVPDAEWALAPLSQRIPGSPEYRNHSASILHRFLTLCFHPGSLHQSKLWASCMSTGKGYGHAESCTDFWGLTLFAIPADSGGQQRGLGHTLNEIPRFLPASVLSRLSPFVPNHSPADIPARPHLTAAPAQHVQHRLYVYRNEDGKRQRPLDIREAPSRDRVHGKVIRSCSVIVYC
jgi:hypothetical protein